MTLWAVLLPSQFLTSGSLLVFITAFLAVLIVKKVISFIQFFRFCQSLPGEKDYSIIYGNLHKTPKTYEGILAINQEYMNTQNSKLQRFWLGPYEALILLFDPKLIKDFIKTGAPKTRGFGGGYEHSIPWFGESVLTSNGSRWYRDRQLINNAFHYNILVKYVSVFNWSADTLMSIVDGYAAKEESFEIFHVASLCLLDIVTKTTMSLDLEAQRTKHPYVRATKKLASIWALRNKTPSLWPNILFNWSKHGKTFQEMCNYVHAFDEDMIAKRRHLMGHEEKKDSKYVDFLDLLLKAKDENGNSMTPLEIRENVDAIMFAGHDTGSSSVSWFLYQMAVHQHYQRKVQQEIDEAMKGRDDNAHVLSSDLNSFTYLTMCLRESMRINPAVPTLSRRLAHDTQIDDLLIPKGTIISIPIIYAQRNPKTWENPLEFIPERFSPQNIKAIDPYAYIPFSAGSRNCPGQHFAMMELKVLLVRLLRRFDFEMDPNGPPVERIYELILRSKDGIWLKAKRRNIPKSEIN